MEGQTRRRLGVNALDSAIMTVSVFSVPFAARELIHLV